MKRADFLKKSVMAAAGGFLAGPLRATAMPARPAGGSVTVLYTNDLHSRIDPFPENSLHYAGQGGFSRRSTMIRRIRAHSEQTLLLDAGDLLQGTPWFQRFGGEVEFELMSRMGYDAISIGEADLDGGMYRYAENALRSGIPVLCANYHAEGTPLAPLLHDSIVRDFGELRVGIFGLGIDLSGKTDPEISRAIRYEEPAGAADRVIRRLREEQECNYIICLSHLGYRYEDKRIDDRKLASRVPGINLVIGGHTHTFLDHPEEILNPEGSRTWVTQMGHSGIRIGRIDLELTDEGVVREHVSRYYTVGPEPAAGKSAG
ncbi:MAG: metallophosphatase [Balneolaceae bacterium]